MLVDAASMASAIYGPESARVADCSRLKPQVRREAGLPVLCHNDIDKLKLTLPSNKFSPRRLRR